MKILFVEDELSKNIPRITRLFSKYLDKNTVKKLNALEADESGYGAAPEEIKRIVEATNLIEVEYRFPEALKKIIQNHDKYALFIIDRNLVEGEYEFDEVRAIDSAFDEAQYEKYFEREGDYLLQKLVYSGVDVMTKFYFLTAYPAEDELRSAENIETHIAFGKFNTENFIEKGDLDSLINIIENIEVLNLQNDNKRYLNILRKYIDDETADRFIKILHDREKEKRIGDNLKEIRIIYQEILRICSQRIPNMEENCTEHEKVAMGHKTIFWLSENGHINSILKTFFFSIKTIASDFGAHKTKERYQYDPTLDTINVLVYTLKDIILWFDKVCRQYNQKINGN